MPMDTETANPGPLGLVAFGLTTVLLSLFNAGLLPPAGEVVVLPLAIVFGGTIQIVAGIMDYVEGNTFASVAFCSYGAFWWWFGLLELFGLNGILNIDPAGVTTALGAALILWGVFTTFMWVSTFRLNWGLWLVFLTLAVTFYLLGFGDLLGNDGLLITGGYVGIVTGMIAMYVSFAEVTNWSFAGTVVPLGGTPFGGSDDSPSEATGD